MTKKKLKLAYINNESVRKITFNKRKKGIMKKIHELSVLCGIKACVIINSSFNPTPEVWPSVSGVRNVVERFQRLPEVDQLKKMLNHATFLQQNIDKTMENNIKRIKDNRVRTMRETMCQILAGKGDMLTLSDRDRVDLIQFINQHLRGLYHHREQTLNQMRLENGEPSSGFNVMAPRVITEVDSSPFSAANVMTRAIHEVGSSSFPSVNLMAPRAITEVRSSAFQNLGVLNSPPLASDLWAIRSINSSNQISEQVNSFANNYLPTLNDQHGYYLMMNPVSVYDQNPNFIPNQYQYQYQYQYQHQFGYPSVMGQDGVYYLNQDPNHQQFGNPPVLGQDGMYNLNKSQNQQEEHLVDPTMTNLEHMMFQAMDDTKQYFHQ